MARKLRCPQCQSVNSFEAGEALVCASCNYGGSDDGAGTSVESNGQVSTPVTAAAPAAQVAEHALETESAQVTQHVLEPGSAPVTENDAEADSAQEEIVPESDQLADEELDEWTYDEIEWDSLTKTELLIPALSFSDLELQLTDRKISHIKTKSGKRETTYIDLMNVEGLEAAFAVRIGVWTAGLLAIFAGFTAVVYGYLQGDFMVTNNLIMMGAGAVAVLLGFTLLATKGMAVSLKIYGGSIGLRVAVRPKQSAAMERFMANTMAAKDHKAGK